MFIPPVPARTEVDTEVARLLGLPADAYGAELLDYVLDPSYVQQFAFRHPRAVGRTVETAGRLLQHHTLSKAQRRAVTDELRLGQLVIMGDDARRGVVPMAGMSDAAFAAALISYVADREPLQQLAFRHPQVVRRTAQTADRLLRDHGPLVQARAGESRGAFERRAKRTRAAMQLELRLAQLIVAGDEARIDRVPYDPSPAARAARRLVAQFPREFLSLKREEQKRDAEVRERAKAGRRRKARGD